MPKLRNGSKGRIRTRAHSIASPVSRSKSSPVPEVVAGSGTMHISNIMDAISICIHITHNCMHSKKLIMWSPTESDV